MLTVVLVLVVAGIAVGVTVASMGRTGTPRAMTSESTLTSAVTSLDQAWSRDGSFEPTALHLLAEMHGPPTFVPGTATARGMHVGLVGATTAPPPGRAVLSVYTVTADLVVLSGQNANDSCWVVALNKSSHSVGTVPSGTWYYGTVAKPSVCSAASFAHLPAHDWKPDFATIRVSP